MVYEAVAKPTAAETTAPEILGIWALLLHSYQRPAVCGRNISAAAGYTQPRKLTEKSPFFVGAQKGIGTSGMAACASQSAVPEM